MWKYRKQHIDDRCSLNIFSTSFFIYITFLAFVTIYWLHLLDSQRLLCIQMRKITYLPDSILEAALTKWRHRCHKPLTAWVYICQQIWAKFLVESMIRKQDLQMELVSNLIIKHRKLILFVILRLGMCYVITLLFCRICI